MRAFAQRWIRMESTQKYRCHHQRHHKSRGAAGAEGGLQLPRPAPIRCTVAARTRGCRPRPSWPRCPRRLRREPTNEGPASVASKQANVSKPKPYAWRPKSVKSTGPRSSAVGVRAAVSHTQMGTRGRRRWRVLVRGKGVDDISGGHTRVRTPCPGDLGLEHLSHRCHGPGRIEPCHPRELQGLPDVLGVSASALGGLCHAAL